MTVTTPLRSVDLVAEVPELTYRKLNYWCDFGLFGAANAGLGSGARRWFTEEDVRVARALALASLLGAELRGDPTGGMSRDTLRLIERCVRNNPDAGAIQLTFCDGRAMVAIDLGDAA